MKPVVKKVALAIVALVFGAISSASAGIDYTLPLTGKFFYAQIFQNEDAGMYVPVIIGSEEGKIITQNWHLSTNEHMLGVYDDTCMIDNMGCVNTRDPNSKVGLVNDNITEGYRQPGGLTNEPAAFVDSSTRYLYDNFMMEGMRMSNQFNMTFHEYQRETLLQDTTSFIIYQIAQPNQLRVDLKDNITGYMGIQPYTTNLQQKEESFLYQLKFTLGFVDNICLSIYRSPDPSGISIIKFGSYDKHGIKDYKTPTVLKTQGIEGWILEASWGMADSDYIFQTDVLTKRSVQINPQYRFSYLPQDDFNKFRQYVLKNFPQVVCDNNAVTCYFPQACSVVPEFTFAITVEVTDNTGTVETISASWHDIKADGALFGQPDTCYFGIFANQGDKLQTYWVAGNNLMAQKYYVLDMGPFVNEEKAYFAVGLGQLNPESIIGETHYDYKSDNFMPELKTNDMSRQISGVNPYDSEQYERGHERRLKFNSGDDEPWYEEYRLLIIIGAIMALFLVISIIMICVYCQKHSKNRFEAKEDMGLINRATSVAYQPVTNSVSSRASINQVTNDQEISLDAGETAGKNP